MRAPTATSLVPWSSTHDAQSTRHSGYGEDKGIAKAGREGDLGCRGQRTMGPSGVPPLYCISGTAHSIDPNLGGASILLILALFAHSAAFLALVFSVPVSSSGSGIFSWSSVCPGRARVWTLIDCYSRPPPHLPPPTTTHHTPGTGSGRHHHVSTSIVA